jgi:general secretion pathway protein L
MFISNEAKAAVQTALAGLATQCRRGGQLWLNEARATIPAPWLVRLGQLAPPLLTLKMVDGAVRGLLQGAGVEAEFVWSAPEVSAEAILEWLKLHQLSRDEVIIWVALDAETFLCRKMLVPVAALGSLQSIIAQEVVRRTPFEPTEIWHTARPSTTTSGSGPEIVEVEHWIIRRDRACAALGAIGLRPEDVDGLVASGSMPPLVIPLREPGIEYPAWAARVVRTAAAGAIAISLLAAVTIEWAASSEMSRLGAAIAQVRGEGAGGKPAAQLLALRASPGVVEVWEELSRVLPDHTFLSELRVADGTVSISGFSGDAAHLIRLLDNSPLFTGAHLTGAITPDKNEHKDHFSLAFRLRTTQRPAERPGTTLARSDP